MFLTVFYLSKLLVKPLKAREGGQTASWLFARAPDDVFEEFLWKEEEGGKGKATQIIVFRCNARIQYLLFAMTAVALWLFCGSS